jgi:signal transduction histidine kinase
VTKRNGGNKEEEKEEGRDYGSNSSSRSRHVIVSVKENGAEIDQEMLPRLCTKFATKSDKGSGLGLYISKSIIQVHGGKNGLRITEMEKLPRLQTTLQR